MKTYLYSAFCGSVVCCSVAFGAYEDAILAEGPVAYWRLDGLSESDPIVDLTGNVPDGEYDIVQGDGFTFGLEGIPAGGTAVSFSGNPGFACGGDCGRGAIDIGGVLDLGNRGSGQALSLEAWFKLLPNANSVLDDISFSRIFHYNNRNEGGQYAFGVLGDDNGGYERARTVWASRGEGDASTIEVSAGTSGKLKNQNDWMHFVATFSSTDRLRMYLNGRSVPAGPADSNSWQTRQATIGGRLQLNQTSLVNAFPGALAHLAIYDKELSRTEVKAHYELGLEPPLANIDDLTDINDRIAWAESNGTFLGDFDLNLKVEFADFVILSNNFNRPGNYADGDYDGNGMVAFADFVGMSTNFGKAGSSVPVAVPEPATSCILLGLVGLVGLATRRHNA